MSNFADNDTPYSQREEWKDVIPIPHSDVENDVVRISYSDEFAEVFSYLRAVIVSKEKSKRAFDLTTHCARLNPANYTVWIFRRDLLKHLEMDLVPELEFVTQIIEDNPKNYQVWHHRKVLIEWLQDPSRELTFTHGILTDDSKNYHAWQHRQWVVETFALWADDAELEYSLKLLSEDIRNNSAWNYRFFVIASTTAFTSDVIDREIKFSLELITKAPHNESAWNYLNGILMEVADDKQKVKPSDETDLVWKLCETLYDDEKRRSPQLMAFMADTLADSGDVGKAIKLYDELVSADPVRTRYWLHQKRSVENAAAK